MDLTSDGNPDHTNVTESKNKIYIILFAKHKNISTIVCHFLFKSKCDLYMSQGQKGLCVPPEPCHSACCLPENEACSVVNLSTGR